MYNKQDHAGNTPDFWEDNWAAGEFEKAVSFCAVDPLRPLFEKYLRPDSLILEGGCGMGHLLAYYSDLGFEVVGLDFAVQTLRKLRAKRPELKVCGGDVSHLPFRDKVFDLYYSGGVVEHFQGGADESLQEAVRVLKDDGIFLVSVPYYSPLRRVLRPIKEGWIVTNRVEEDLNEPFQDRKFFQYLYRPNEFEKMLAASGLVAIERQGYSVLWGLDEIPFIRVVGSPQPSISDVTTNKSVEPSPETIALSSHASLLKRLLVSEDDSIPLLGLGVKVMRWAAANMMMYVCKKNQ
ncbi:MAG: methyltransferase domain-containing protein [Pyrinomonadaceae bacterium]